jgi:hypothetical protein
MPFSGLGDPRPSERDVADSMQDIRVMARSESHRHASKVGRAFGARTEKASAAVRLPSSHARANRIVTEAAGPHAVACDGNGNPGARGEADDTDTAYAHDGPASRQAGHLPHRRSEMRLRLDGPQRDGGSHNARYATRRHSDIAD